MLTEYLQAAMKLAEYEIMEDGTYWGHIHGFLGVWANEATLAACQEELQSVLEDWLIVKLWHNDDDIPVVGKLNLIPVEKPAKRGSRIKTPAHSTP